MYEASTQARSSRQFLVDLPRSKLKYKGNQSISGCKNEGWFIFFLKIDTTETVGSLKPVELIGFFLVSLSNA